jgi:protein tyrosine phosphatase
MEIPSSEEVKYFKHIQDVAWEDNSAPDLKGMEKLNYLRMKYLVTKMVKYRERQLRNFQILPDTTKFNKTLVHCSAGTGRTGTLISAYCIVESLVQMQKQFSSPSGHQRYEVD